MIYHHKKPLINAFQKLTDIKLNDNIEQSLQQSFELQNILIRRIISIEKRLTANNQVIKDLRAQIHQSDHRDERIAKGMQISHLRDINREYKQLLNIYRTVGDGLAILYFGKSDIKALTSKQSSGFLSGEKGLKRELLVLSEFYKKKIPSVLNDITNCLRYGDITAPHPLGCFPLLVEVKGGVVTSRSLRQLDNMIHMAKYLEANETDSLYGLGPVKRLRTESPGIYHTNEINESIELAIVNGYSLRRIEHGLVYFVMHRPKYHDIDTTVLAELKKPVACIIDSLKCPKGYLPFTLSIDSPERLYDFYLGRLLVTIIVDIQVLIDNLNRFDLVTEYKSGPYPLNIRRVDISDKYGVLSISDYYLKRLFFEFQSLESFAEGIKELYLKAQQAIATHNGIDYTGA